jgi:hypothetical protein
MDVAPMKRLEGDAWLVEVPGDLAAKPHRAWGYEGGVIARGWIGDAPMTVVVQERELKGSFSDWVRRVHHSWLEHSQRRVEVPGATDAIRTDGRIEFDGLGAEDDIENCTTVIAKRGHHVWSLTVRTRPEDGIADAVEPIVASFELVTAQSSSSSRPDRSTSASP